MSDSRNPFDVGLQLERTALAWRRTALALAVAALAGVKVLFDSLGYAAVVIGVAGLVLALVLGVVSSMRYRSARHWLRVVGADEPPMPGATLLALCTALVLATGVLAAGYVVLS